MTQCRFCSVPIDPGVAQLVADKQEKVNQAVSDASYLRTTAIAMYVFLGLSFVPILPVVDWGFVIIFVVVIVLLIRWQIKFSGLVTSDVDYKKARRSWLISLVLLVVAVPLGFIVRPLILFLALGPRG
jgi:hypothetical protein